MPFYSSIAARNAYQNPDVEKRQKHLGEVMGEAVRDDDDDEEVVPHDRAGRPLDPETREPIEADDADDADDVGDYDGGVDELDDDDETSSVEKSRHAFGRSVPVDGHGHGGVPRAQVYNPQRPQPADAGSLSTPRSGALASSIGGNPAEVQVQQLDYRAQSGPQVTFPHTALAQPAPHPARPTAPGGNR